MKELLLTKMVCVLGAIQAYAGGAFADGKALFVEYCEQCHAIDDTGRTDAADRLKTRPADLTKIAARRDGVWPMLEVMSIIDGYTKQADARKDMPVISALSDGPIVELDTGNGIITTVPERLIAMSDYLESLQSPKPDRYVP